jgi:hypothetical protein
VQAKVRRHLGRDRSWLKTAMQGKKNRPEEGPSAVLTGLRLFPREVQLFSHSSQVRQGSRIHLSHARHRSAPLRPAGTRRADPSDSLSATGAHKMAEQIRQFWKSCGFDVVVRIEPLAVPGLERNGAPSFSIRSNLVAGLPPGPNLVPTCSSTAASE